MATNDENYLSDDEIFFGKLTIKEVKKHIHMDMHRHSVMCNITKEDNDNKSDDSFKIIETCSEPDLNLLSQFNNSFSSFSSEIKEAKSNINSANNSFLEMEKLVSDEIDMHKCNEQRSLDNTLDVVDHILINALTIKDNVAQNESVNTNNGASNNKDVQQLEQLKLEVNKISLMEEEAKQKEIRDEKITIESISNHSPEIFSENSSLNQALGTNTTKSLMKKRNPDKAGVSLTQKVDNCKTSQAVLSVKKSNILTPKKIPSKTYKNVISPVATYIKSTTQVSTIRNIRTTKPLQGTCSIPKLLRTNKTKDNKENVSLPAIAHKNAKHVKVINSPADDPEEMIAKSPWKKQMLSSLSKINVVQKHVHKEKINLIKKSAESQQEESFANLTVHQAEVSLCTIVPCNSEKKKHKYN